MARLLLALAALGCASSQASTDAVASDAGTFGPATSTSTSTSTATLVLGGRCPRWTESEAELVVSGAGIAGALEEETPVGSFAFRFDFDETRLAPGPHDVGGTLIYLDDEVVAFEPTEGSVVRDAALEARHDRRPDPDREERVVMVGTLAIDEMRERFAGTLDVEFQGDIPPMQPGCGAGGTLSLRFDARR
ncbi:MAG: hypothetical protein AAF447_02950 [Myxococcota bacterium]